MQIYLWYEMRGPTEFFQACSDGIGPSRAESAEMVCAWNSRSVRES
jgi:hypothetical protein